MVTAFDPRPFCTCSGPRSIGHSPELRDHLGDCAAWKVSDLLAKARREALEETLAIVQKVAPNQPAQAAWLIEQLLSK